MKRMTSKGWYLVAAGLVLAGVAFGAAGISRTLSTVEDMQRVVMPGKAEITLPAGTSTLYAESESVVGGQEYRVSGELDLRCGVTGPAGEEVSLERSSSKVTYSFGDHAGQNAFDVHVGAAGTYVLECEAPEPFVIAIGGGVGTWIAIGVVGALVLGGLGVLTFILVLVWRSGQKRTAAAAAAAAALPRF